MGGRLHGARAGGRCNGVVGGVRRRHVQPRPAASGDLGQGGGQAEDLLQQHGHCYIPGYHVENKPTRAKGSWIILWAPLCIKEKYICQTKKKKKKKYFQKKKKKKKKKKK